MFLIRVIIVMLGFEVQDATASIGNVYSTNTLLNSTIQLDKLLNKLDTWNSRDCCKVNGVYKEDLSTVHPIYSVYNNCITSRPWVVDCHLPYSRP